MEQTRLFPPAFGPCPYCGAKDGQRLKRVWKTWWFVGCTCTAAGPARKTREEAVAAWNERMSCEPVRKSHHEGGCMPRTISYAECSACGHVLCVRPEPIPSYCPACGAKVRRGDAEHRGD